MRKVVWDVGGDVGVAAKVGELVWLFWWYR
jgi:hypothetical protein